MRSVVLRREAGFDSSTAPPPPPPQSSPRTNPLCVHPRPYASTYPTVSPDRAHLCSGSVHADAVTAVEVAAPAGLEQDRTKRITLLMVAINICESMPSKASRDHHAGVTKFSR